MLNIPVRWCCLHRAPVQNMKRPQYCFLPSQYYGLWLRVTLACMSVLYPIVGLWFKCYAQQIRSLFSKEKETFYMSDTSPVGEGPQTGQQEECAAHLSFVPLAHGL